MGSFLDLCRVLARDPVKSFYYLCGPEAVLREQALDMIRAKVAAPVQDTEMLSAAEHPAGQIWDAVLTYSETATRRFITVRDAERLSTWDRFWEYTDLLSRRRAPVATIVLLSAAEDFGERVSRCARGHSNSIDLLRTHRSGRQVHHCKDCLAIKNKITSMHAGQYTEMASPSEVTAMKLVCGSFDDYWPGWLGCSRQDALKVMEAVGWDLKSAYDLCQKIRLSGVRVSEKALRLLANRPADETFVDSLSAMRRGDAAGMARALSSEESRRAVGQLERRVDLLARMHRAMRREDSTQLLASQLNVHYKLVESLRPYARHYDSDRVNRASIQLARTDAALQRGAEAGALELLTLLW